MSTRTASDSNDPIVESRDQLAALVVGAEQVLVTAAVAADVPAALQGTRFVVAGGEVRRADG